jgi:hypothetical protein
MRSSLRTNLVLGALLLSSLRCCSTRLQLMVASARTCRFLNSAFVPRRNMSTASPQIMTGEPFVIDAGGDHKRRNNHNRKRNRERSDDEGIPSDLRNYNYDTNINNPAETFDRVTQEIAQYVATEYRSQATRGDLSSTCRKRRCRRHRDQQLLKDLLISQMKIRRRGIC